MPIFQGDHRFRHTDISTYRQRPEIRVRALAGSIFTCKNWRAPLICTLSWVREFYFNHVAAWNFGCPKRVIRTEMRRTCIEMTTLLIGLMCMERNSSDWHEFTHAIARWLRIVCKRH